MMLMIHMGDELSIELVATTAGIATHAFLKKMYDCSTIRLLLKQ